MLEKTDAIFEFSLRQSKSKACPAFDKLASLSRSPPTDRKSKMDGFRPVLTWRVGQWFTLKTISSKASR